MMTRMAWIFQPFRTKHFINRDAGGRLGSRGWELNFMPSSTSLAELLTDQRIAGLVAVPTPALLIEREGKLLFANPAGLAAIGAKTLQDAVERGTAGLGPLAEAARRFSENLPSAG